MVETIPNDNRSSLIQTAKRWGESPLPPMLMATLITGQSLQPPRLVPLLFPPVFLLSAYMNLNNVVGDSAGITAAWSGLYLLLARRRKQPWASKWSVRGIVRGATMGTCAVNLLGCGLVYGLSRTGSNDVKEDAIK